MLSASDDVVDGVDVELVLPSDERWGGSMEASLSSSYGWHWVVDVSCCVAGGEGVGNNDDDDDGEDNS